MKNTALLRDCGLLLICGAFVLSAQQGSTGYIKTKVNPGRAGVFVDGKYLGPAANFRIARKYAVPVGDHELKLVEPRYEEFTTKVTVVPGKTTTVSQALKPLEPAKPPFGRLRVVGGEKFSAVFLNDKYVGHVDEFSNFAQGLLLNPGDYTVKVVPLAGGAGKEEKVTIAADKVTVVDVRK